MLHKYTKSTVKIAKMPPSNCTVYLHQTKKSNKEVKQAVVMSMQQEKPSEEEGERSPNFNKMLERQRGIIKDDKDEENSPEPQEDYLPLR
jgi:hypothetical protein